MRLFKETGAAGILNYIFICSVIVGAALFAASSLKTVLDTETNAKITTVSNELGDITADSSANSYILWMHLSPSEAFLLADSAVDTIEHYDDIASHLNADLQDFKDDYFSQPAYEQNVAGKAAAINTYYTNALSYEAKYEVIANPTETDKYDFYYYTNIALDASLVDLQAILDDYDAAANQIMINHYSWASFYDAEYTTKAQNAGTDNDTNTAAFLAAVDSRMDNLNAILQDNPPPGYSTVIGVSDFDNFDFDSENTQKRQYVEQVADDREAIETMKIDGNGIEDENGDGIEDVVKADIENYVSTHLGTAIGNKSDIDASINGLVEQSTNDSNNTNVTAEDIKAVLNTLDVDGDGSADVGSADLSAINPLSGQYSASMGLYDSLVQGVTNLTGLMTDLSTNLLSSLTDEASYTDAKEDYKDVADLHVLYSNSDKTTIANYLSNTSIINDKQNAWDAYSTAYTTLSGYNDLSVAAFDGYLSGNAYLTDTSASTYDSKINTAYDNAPAPNIVSSYSYNDINTANTSINVVNPTALSDLNFLLNIFNNTIDAEFADHNTTGNNHYDNEKLKLTNSGLTATGDLEAASDALDTAKTNLTNYFNNGSGSGAAVGSTSTTQDVVSRKDAVNEIKDRKDTLELIILGQKIKDQALDVVDGYLSTAQSNFDGATTDISNKVNLLSSETNKSRHLTIPQLSIAINGDYEGKIGASNQYSDLYSNISYVTIQKNTINSFDVNAAPGDYVNGIKTPLANAAGYEVTSDTIRQTKVTQANIDAVADALADSYALCHSKIDVNGAYSALESANCDSDNYTSLNGLSGFEYSVANEAGKVTKLTNKADETFCTQTKNYIFVAYGQNFSAAIGTTISGPGNVTFTFTTGGSYAYTNVNTISFEASDFTDGQGLCIEWSNP